MKKIICILLIALFVPIVSFSDETDPIIGVWYICIDSQDFSNDLSAQGYLYSAMLFHFSENGEIVFAEIDFKGSAGEISEPQYIGKWEKNGNEYKTSVISAGVNRAWFEDDLLYFSLNDVQYHGLRKMTNIDMYYNIYRK